MVSKFSCLVATPGRLLDHTSAENGKPYPPSASFSSSTEARDRMRDMCFPARHNNQGSASSLSMLPAKRQSLLFSRTYFGMKSADCQQFA